MKKIFWLIIVISCLLITGCSKKQYEVKFIGLNGEIIESFNKKAYLFLDDKQENIDAAISCGINGYVFDYNKFDTFLNDINKKYNI